MIKCVIIDKDKASRAATEKCVAQFPHLNLLKSFSTVADAAETIKDNKVDVVFLSIPPAVDHSLDFLKFMKYERPDLVFISSEKKLAKEAFDHDATDFILAPVTVDRVAKSLAKISKTFNTEELMMKSSVLFVKDKRHWVKVLYSDIFLIEALSDYVNIYTKDKRYTVHATMKSMEKRMPANEFIRIHNSYIVRIESIKEIDKDSVTVEDKTLPVSHTYKKALLEKLKIV